MTYFLRSNEAMLDFPSPIFQYGDPAYDEKINPIRSKVLSKWGGGSIRSNNNENEVNWIENLEETFKMFQKLCQIVIFVDFVKELYQL